MSKNTMHSFKAAAEAIFTLLLILLAIAALLKTYSTGGIYWDFIAHIFFAKALITQSFYSALLSGRLISAINYSDSFYFEYFRAPLMPVLLALLLPLLGSSTATAYILFSLLLLTFSLFYLSRAMHIELMALIPLFLTPYFLAFLTLLNGTEILTSALLIISTALLVKGKWQSGIVLALAGLAKYPSLVFLPMLLMLKGKARAKAVLAFAIATLPWLIFNAYAFGNPLKSYLTGFSEFKSGTSANFAALMPSLQITFRNLLPYLVLAAFLLLLLIFWSFLYFAFLNKKTSRGNKSKNKRQLTLAKTINNESTQSKIAALLILGFIGFLFLAMHGNIDNLPRYGYLIYIGVALGTAYLITQASKEIGQRIKGEAGSGAKAFIYLLIFAICTSQLLYLYYSNSTSFIFNGYGSKNSTITNSVAALKSLGLYNCNVVSNAWVYLLYQGIKAHSPYYYNSTVTKYAIVAFKSIGVNESLINISSVAKIYNYENFSIEIPANYICK